MPFLLQNSWKIRTNLETKFINLVNSEKQFYQAKTYHLIVRKISEVLINEKLDKSPTVHEEANNQQLPTVAKPDRSLF